MDRCAKSMWPMICMRQPHISNPFFWTNSNNTSCGGNSSGKDNIDWREKSHRYIANDVVLIHHAAHKLNTNNLNIYDWTQPIQLLKWKFTNSVHSRIPCTVVGLRFSHANWLGQPVISKTDNNTEKNRVMNIAKWGEGLKLGLVSCVCVFGVQINLFVMRTDLAKRSQAYKWTYPLQYFCFFFVLPKDYSCWRRFTHLFFQAKKKRLKDFVLFRFL